MAERKRAIQLKFYVTEQERILIEEKMKLLQTDNLGAYLRKMAIDGYIIQLDYTAVKEQTAEICSATFIAALFVIASNWKQLICPST